MAQFRSEDGVTLPETLMAMVAGVVVLSAVMTFIFVASRQHDSTVERVTALDESTIGFERVQREVRQALAVDPSPAGTSPQSTGVLRVRVWVATGSTRAKHWIRYDCVSVPGRCTRRDETAGTAAQTLISGLTANSGPTAFRLERATAPAVLPSVQITLSRAVTGGTNPILLTSTVTPRNCQDGLPAGSATCDS